MKKIAHIADLHIGSNQYGIQRRKIEQRNTILKLSEELKLYDICLVAGDVFDSPSPSPDDISLWWEFTENISSGGCDIVACVGNHDKLYKTSSQWIDLSTFIAPRKKYTSDISPFHQTIIHGIQIVYLDHIKRRDLPDVINQIPECDILMMHQSTAGFMSSIMRPEIDEELFKIISLKCRYIALGDLHVHKIMKLSKKCIAAYPGNIDFLRLCDPYSDFRYLSISFNQNEIEEIKSISFNPTQKTYVVGYESDKKTIAKIEDDIKGFYIIRHTASDSEAVSYLIESLLAKFPEAVFYSYRERPRPTKTENSEAIVEEDTDFISLVEKEQFLDENDINIINDIWNNPSADHVESVLSQDLRTQINANN